MIRKARRRKAIHMNQRESTTNDKKSITKYILIPDSFKGTMSSIKICQIMEESIRRFQPHAQILSIPVADGGEGTVDCFLTAIKGERSRLSVCGPYPDEPITAEYALLEEGKIAVLETASCAGLPLVTDRANPGRTTTYGLGEQIQHALSSGAQKLIVGLGGSATNDGGCGAAAAVGVRFYNAEGQIFIPTGITLSEIASIDCSRVSPLLRETEIVAMCDIDNPMYGENGAAHVFAPQKGADEAMVHLLDDGLRHLARLIQRDIGIDASTLPGAGAAGALGAGMAAFFGAKLQMGIDIILETVGFDQLLDTNTLVFTGEGKIDKQSLRGKVVIGVARHAKVHGTPVIAFVGDIGDDIDSAYDEGVTGIFSINRIAAPYSVLRNRAENDLRLTVENFLRVRAMDLSHSNR